MSLFVEPKLFSTLRKRLTGKASKQDVVRRYQVGIDDLIRGGRPSTRLLLNRQHLADITAQAGLGKGHGIDLLAIAVPLNSENTFGIWKDPRGRSVKATDPSEQVHEAYGLRHFLDSRQDRNPLAVRTAQRAVRGASALSATARVSLTSPYPRRTQAGVTAPLAGYGPGVCREADDRQPVAPHPNERPD